VSISPGVILKPEYAAVVPVEHKQKCSIDLFSLRYGLISLDIAFTVSHLERICASAGAAQRAALHQLMDNSERRPSFKITYRRGKEKADLLSGCADSDLGNSSSR
jgi:hypothetical protein